MTVTRDIASKKVVIEFDGKTIIETSLRRARVTAKEIKTYNQNLSSYYMRDETEVMASEHTMRQLRDENIKARYEKLRYLLDLD